MMKEDALAFYLFESDGIHSYIQKLQLVLIRRMLILQNMSEEENVRGSDWVEVIQNARELGLMPSASDQRSVTWEEIHEIVKERKK
jgi:hypothetical protein